ncbi:MAG: 4Fe-4S binding protein [Candidatus Thorarchaeota archaeon]
MGLRQRIKEATLIKIGKLRYMKILEKEGKIKELYKCISSTPESPVRFEIPLEAIKRIEEGKSTKFFRFKILPVLIGSIRGILKGFNEINKNPSSPKTTISNNELQNLQDFIMSLGIGMIGYCELPSKYIFQNKSILYKNCIVLIMEMNKEKIDKAPSYDTFHEVHRTYRDLGIATNKIANYLRKNGFGAHPIHPLGGAVLTPPIAKIAGLGWQGHHGMIITPKYGPRMRIAAVLTSIENLPFSIDNPHSWIEDWCKKCGVCIRKCPTSAIKIVSIEQNNGLINHIETEKCFPYFVENHGCSVCIKECQFNKLGYDLLKIKHYSTF